MLENDVFEVDVIIPVYNAPEITRKCIDSLYAHLGDRVREVHIHDNASDLLTARMLDGLKHPRLRVYHAPTNTGFGDAVNQAFTRSQAPFILVLNSDTETRDDFLSPLQQAMRIAAPRLAAINPAGNTFNAYDLSRYMRRNGCVVTHNLSGYAFLIRREAFEQVGGFCSAFNPGFFEDTDLSRRLINKGWWMGVHPDAKLYHEIHGSFREASERREQMAKSRKIYYELYPVAMRQVVLISGNLDLPDFPPGVLDAAEEVMNRGGKIHWLRPTPPYKLPALSMRPLRPTLRNVLKLINRGRRKPDERLTDIWIAPGASTVWVRLLCWLAGQIAIQSWE